MLLQLKLHVVVAAAAAAATTDSTATVSPLIFTKEMKLIFNLNMSCHTSLQIRSVVCLDAEPYKSFGYVESCCNVVVTTFILDMIQYESECVC